MGIRKQRRVIKENREIGSDAENSQFYKDYIKHNLNPFSNSHVERHDKRNDPYDYKVITEKNGRISTRYKEIKSGNAVQSPQEKEFHKNHSRSYDLERTGRESILNDARKLKRQFF